MKNSRFSLEEIRDIARRDDAFSILVPSDVRVLVGEIERLIDANNKMQRRSFYEHIAPPKADIEANRAKEPEGERIRAELEDFLKRNKIVAMLLDTESHYVEIDVNKLPPYTKSVLTHWGAIRIEDEE